MEGVLLIPKILSFFMNSKFPQISIDDWEEKNYVCEEVLRDMLLLTLVLVFDKLRFSFPKKVFVVFGSYVFVSDIINDLTYKCIEKNSKLRKNWQDLQKRQIESLVQNYVSLKRAKDEF